MDKKKRNYNEIEDINQVHEEEPQQQQQQQQRRRLCFQTKKTLSKGLWKSQTPITQCQTLTKASEHSSFPLF
jgi:hypothetical protein